RFLHRTNKAKAYARQSLDKTLPLAGIAYRISRGIQSRRQRSIGDDASVPDGANKVVLADDALSVPDQVIEQVKNLRCGRNCISCPIQFTPFRVERVILKEIAQVAIPSGSPLCPLKQEE